MAQWICSSLAVLHSYFPAYYEIPAAALFVILALSTWPRRASSRNWFVSDLAFMLLLAFFVAWMRWPILANGELNVDESLHLASAMALRMDPLYWRSVDEGTVGPLVSYTLYLVSIVGLGPNYLTAKLVALVLAIVSTVLTYSAMRRLLSPSVARAVTLLLALALALMKVGDFVAYNGEYLVMALLAVALYFVALLATNAHAGSWRIAFLAGLILGAVPFAKLQGIPMGGVVAVYAGYVIVTHRGRRHTHWSVLAALVIGGLIPLIVAGATAQYSIGFNAFVQRFILAPLFYTDVHVNRAEAFRLLWRRANMYNELWFRTLWIASLGLFVIILPLLLCWKLAVSISRSYRLFPETSGTRLTSQGFRNYLIVFMSSVRSAIARSKADLASVLFAILFVLMAAVSTYLPGRAFPHYAMLWLLPMAWFLATGLHVVATQVPQFWLRQAMIAMVALGIVLSVISDPSATRFSGGLFRWAANGQPSALQDCPALYVHPLAKQIRRYVHPGDRMSVWGWNYRLYVEVGIPPATAIDMVHIFGFPNRSYFASAYAEELSASAPEIFVDAVAPGMFAYSNRQEFGMKNVPKIDTFVHEHYGLVERVSGVRIYVRRDLLAARGLHLQVPLIPGPSKD